MPATLTKQSSPEPLIRDTIRTIQEHLDKEARVRQRTFLKPNELCPMQKAELVNDLSRLLG